MAVIRKLRPDDVSDSGYESFLLLLLQISLTLFY